MLYIIYQEDRPDGAAIRAATREDHFAYLAKNEDILVLGGALLEDDDATRKGSVLIINVPNRAAAEAFSENEPFRKAGLFNTGENLADAARPMESGRRAKNRRRQLRRHRIAIDMPRQTVRLAGPAAQSG